jgi:hypothetical protein
MDNTTQKMKRIPFDLQLALSGQATFIDGVDTETQFIAQCDSKLWMKFNNGKTAIFSIDSAYHLTPYEPKAERWAVVHNSSICLSQDAAYKQVERHYDPLQFTVVKLAN